MTIPWMNHHFLVDMVRSVSLKHPHVCQKHMFIDAYISLYNLYWNLFLSSPMHWISSSKKLWCRIATAVASTAGAVEVPVGSAGFRGVMPTG